MSAVKLVCFLVTLLQTVFSVEDQWLLLKRANPEELVHITLALKQINSEWLDGTLKAVSDPRSARYGQHLSLEQVVYHVHADPNGVRKIKDLFKEYDIHPQFTIGEGFAIVDMPVASAEDMFSAKFYHYQHRTDSNTTTIHTSMYTLPPSIAPYVDFTCCIDQFPSTNVIGSVRSYHKSSGLSATPQSIREEYEIGDYKASNANTTQAIAGFLKQYFDPKDLAKFQQRFNIPSNPIAKVIGKNTPLLAGTEASLDVEYITAIGQKVVTWFYSITTFSNKGQEDFLSWLTTLVNTSNVPLVHSVSYGDYEDTIETSYMLRCEQEFKKLGIMGVTILFASGDSGVNCHGSGSKFRPNWPSSSPSLTTVGGTDSVKTTVWSEGGGGFSNVFPVPDYQTDTLKNWLTNGDPPASKYFNSSGRAYPDISAFAVNFEIIQDGGGLEVEGTSCAAPTAAGLISLLNDVRLNKGLKPLGFMNPLLYQTLGKNGFFDVTKGKNDGEGLFCPGFKAVAGWDPASGWGSPDFKRLQGLMTTRQL